MTTLPNSARTELIIGGQPAGDPIRVQFPWPNEQGKLELKTGTLIGSQTVRTISNAKDANGVPTNEVLASEIQKIVSVEGETNPYIVGCHGVMRQAD